MLKTNLQNSIDFNGQDYVGLDVHKKSWAVTVRSMGIQIAHFTQPPGQVRLPGMYKRTSREVAFIQPMKLVCGTGIHDSFVARREIELDC